MNIQDPFLIGNENEQADKPLLWNNSCSFIYVRMM